jgi:hypothetical protein
VLAPNAAAMLGSAMVWAGKVRDSDTNYPGMPAGIVIGLIGVILLKIGKATTGSIAPKSMHNITAWLALVAGLGFAFESCFGATATATLTPTAALFTLGLVSNTWNYLTRQLQSHRAVNTLASLGLFAVIAANINEGLRLTTNNPSTEPLTITLLSFANLARIATLGYSWVKTVSTSASQLSARYAKLPEPDASTGAPLMPMPVV